MIFLVLHIITGAWGLSPGELWPSSQAERLSGFRTRWKEGGKEGKQEGRRKEGRNGTYGKELLGIGFRDLGSRS